MNDYLFGGLLGAGATLILIGVVAKLKGSNDEIDLIDISRDDDLNIIEF